VVTPHVIVASHRRSGTHLTIDAILNNFEGFDTSGPSAEVNLDRLAPRTAGTLSLAALREELARGPRIVKTHTHPDVVGYLAASEEVGDFARRLLRDSKRIYVHRDGRDVLASLYHYVRRFHPEGEALSFGAFLRATGDPDAPASARNLDRAAFWAFHVRAWLAREGVLVLAFGDLATRYEETLERVAAFLDRPRRRETRDVRLSDRSALAVWRAKLAQRLLPPRLQRVKRSSVSFRRGASGDWREVFDDADLALFEARAGDLNRELGYA
jgi:hypothetical protein